MWRLSSWAYDNHMSASEAEFSLTCNSKRSQRDPKYGKDSMCLSWFEDGKGRVEKNVGGFQEQKAALS